MLKFYLIDKSPSIPITSEVPEPIGWEEINLRLKRDLHWHAFFDFWDDAITGLKWYGKAFDIITNAYAEFGLQAQIDVAITYLCEANNVEELLYEGRCNFSRYKITCADWCSVELGIETQGCLISLRNRIEQKVNLNSLASRDSDINDMPNYRGLNQLLTFPIRPIKSTNEWKSQNQDFNYTDSILVVEPTGTTGTYYYSFNWPEDLITEIHDANQAELIYGEKTLSGSPLSRFMITQQPLLRYQPETSINCVGQFEIKIEINGSINVVSTDSISFGGQITLAYGDSSDVSSLNLIPLQTGFGCTSCNSAGGVINISTTISANLLAGHVVYLFFSMSNVAYLTGGGGGTPSDPFELTLHIDSASLKVTVDSTCTATPAKVYMVNEVLSRIAESYTGDCLRVYSDYFGRVDAQPYPSPVNGCGSLVCLTSGLKIRTKSQGFIKIGDSEFTPQFTLSMKECFDALNAIHNIGMGIEPDTVRNDGSEWLRVEPMEYFYRDEVLMTCTLIRELHREFDSTRAFDRASIGYNTWETESVNGLNDVFGKREYRTSLKQVRNLYERLCPFIASDYAIEITRRQYGNTTKDWRYDNDTFIICLRNGIMGAVRFQGPHTISVDGDFTDTLQAGDVITVQGSTSNDGTFTLVSFNFDGIATDMVMAETVISEIATAETLITDITHPFYTVEQNTTETGGATSNILYPEYCYNLRITPARNALRHTKTLMSSYGNNWAGKQIMFSAGDGNYVAILDLKENDCTQENDGALLENGNIGVATVQDENSIKPVYTAEVVTFEYPVSYEQYKIIKANPYGLIGYQCGAEDLQYGYIEDFSYKPAQGLAEFTLRPKL